MLIITSMLVSYLGGFPIGAWGGANIANAAGVNEDTPPPPTPQVLTVPPVTDPHLPTLSVLMQVTPHEVAVGDTFTITLTVTNSAPDVANNLAATLPVPQGVTRVGSSPTGDWNWQMPTLEGNGGSATFVATARLTRPPEGDAIVARAQVMADGLSVPVVSEGGALFLSPNRGPANAQFNPGNAAALRSQDGRTHVQVPSNAYSQTLTLQHTFQQTPGRSVPPHVAGRKKGLGTFYLNANDAQGHEVHQFSAPLTVTVAYTPQQLQATGISEDDLSLFWYDDTQPDNAHWVPVDTDVNSADHTVSASVRHFTAFQLSDTSSPSTVFIPSLQGWQVGMYQGDVSYQYPIEVPAGPAGMKPSVALSYNSASTDGPGGKRPTRQSGWVGKGWSLDTGYIAVNRLPGIDGPSRYYSMVFDGQSFELVRGDALIEFPAESNPSHWDWRPTNESFIKVRAISNGVSTSTRGGATGGSLEFPYARYKWQVWTKSGILYDFEDDAWQGYSDCGSPSGVDANFMETYKWLLTRVEDTHGNRINYTYGRYSVQVDKCAADWSRRVGGTIDGDVHPTIITWGGNVNTGAGDRYGVEFVSSARSIDTAADEAGGAIPPAPQETRRLDAIKVWSMQSSTWELVRQYNLGYETNSANYLLSDSSRQNQPLGTCPDNNDAYCSDPNYPKLTLKQIQRIANDGTTALPATTFTYGLNRGTAKDPNGDWNRLTVVNNGQGGTATFTYETISASLRPIYGTSWGTDFFLNNRRVLTKVLTDGQNHSYTWSYSYPNSAYGVATPPAYNSLGTSMSWQGPNDYPNSATLYFNKQLYDTQDNSSRLVIKKHSQFRGHAYVIETDPNGNETEHWFYQGDAGCTPTATGESIDEDSCFLEILKREFLKGREYKTISHAGSVSAAKLSEANHTFSYVFLSAWSGDERLNGLWRAFTYESQTVQKAWEGAGSSLNKTTDYYYETTYGNLTQVNEIDNGTLARYTIYNYSTKDDPANYPNTYIVDRKRAERVFDGSANLLAKSVYGYDGYTDGNTLGTKGDLTLQRKYYDIVSPIPTTIHSNDTSYGYDSYGNQTTVTTYAGPGEAASNGTSYSAPGYSGGIQSASRTTTTTYDTIFHAFPIQVDPPVVNLALTESATYDYRMGTLQSVTGANGWATTVNARYDLFGRMVKMWKPGDSETIPTLEAYYHDNEVPFKYLVTHREVSGNVNLHRPITKFYDGLGREIQTKAESKDGIQNIVVDKLYDGLGQVTQQRQPRTVDNTANDPAFWNYVTPTWTGTGVNKTTTTYDALGRVLTVTEPDTTVTTMSYWLNTTDGRTVARTIDAKGHGTEHESDMLGRLIAVKEYNGTSMPYTLDATTIYEYNPLDLLTKVTDAYGKQTTMQYDSLGRKSSMTDLAMGAWSYVYDVNGNLKTQTDARSQVITFNYDALNRLTSKSWPSYGTNPAESLVYKYDQTSTGYSYGKGERTSTIRCTGVANTTCTGTGATQTSQVQWKYDTRGQNTSTTYTLNGLTGTRTVLQAYDSGGRVTSITYPTGEVVQYAYDAAWRQVSAYSSTYSTYYANNATYTALDQPSSFTLGNTLTQSYQYDTVMQRLSSIQVGTGGSIFNRGYTYDNVGNVATITGSPTINTQTFTYDQRDRLSTWTATGISESYQYDFVGNITSKAGVSNTYNYNQLPGAGGPYAIRNSGYTYDNNGNMTAMPTNSRTLVWNTENQPVSITSSGTTETYTYDADGARIKKVRGTATTTYYIGGLAEEDVPTGRGSNVTRSMYTFNGQVIAQRTVTSGGFGSDTLVYLHSDHLGSVGASTTSAGGSLSSQEYDPWGKVRTGGVTQSKYNYTGQKLDDTGLLFYNARYYDPLVGRFTSPDSIVPGTNDMLQTDFHEGGLTSEQVEAGRNQAPSGPRNAQQLNRYSYVLNNPVLHRDPTGHRCADGYTDSCTNLGGRNGQSNPTSMAVTAVPPQILETQSQFVEDEILNDQAIGSLCKSIGGCLAAIGAGILKAALNVGGKIRYLRVTGGAVTATRIAGSLASSQVLQKAVDAATDPNKINHIFGKAQHNLGAVLSMFGGNTNAVMTAVVSNLGNLPTSGVFQSTVNFGNGIVVTVTGAVVNGVPMIGTMWR